VGGNGEPGIPPTKRPQDKPRFSDGAGAALYSGVGLFDILKRQEQKDQQEQLGEDFIFRSLFPMAQPHTGDSVQNVADSQSPQSPITTQADRTAEGADKKVAKNEKRAQKAQKRKAAAEAFREANAVKSKVKKNQNYDDPDNSRWTRLGRRVTKIKHRKF
jgi:hypothetical protein